jgi:glyoxylate reductase
VGVDHINVRDATARGIKVGNTPGVLNGATADLAFALILATARGIVKNDHYARSPEFTVYDPGFFLGQEVHGSVIGIIGMGGIGEQIAKRAYAFDMKILYHNRNRNLSAEAKYDASYASLAELLRRCDFVVLSCPLTSETRGLIGVAQLAQMKPSAILVNVARGGVVNTDALTAALASRQILRAGLDVTDPEPLPRDHPLLQSEHVTILPHLGSATVQTRTRMAELSVRNLMCGLRGQPLLHSVL